MESPKEQIANKILKRAAPWVAVVGITIGSFVALSIICYKFLFQPELFDTLLKEHVHAVVGIPMAAVYAFCVVLTLEASSGPIEFEALGFKFRGASGPVVLWVFSFLGFVLAIRLLW